MIDIFEEDKIAWKALSSKEQEAMIAYLYLVRVTTKIEHCESSNFLKGMMMWTTKKNISSFNVPMKYHKISTDKLKKYFDNDLLKTRRIGNE